MRSKLFLLCLCALLLATGTLAGCGSGGGNNEAGTAPVGLTGSITLEKASEAGEMTVPSQGGTVAITAEDPAVNGLTLDVPADAYPDATQFTISYAPVKEHSFGDGFNPISPMISIDNGDKLADEPIEVTMPVTVPEGEFAMAFYYDDEAGTLEGLPLVSTDATSMTVATRHFSNIVVSATGQDLTAVSADSGFRPGVDDWQFVNNGSYIEQEGHCSGQSMTAMWYYIAKPDGPDAHLYGRYDNNGNAPATPDFWQDDSYGYRLASVVQHEEDFGSAGRRIGLNLSKDPLKAWNMFAYTMQLTGQPQMVEIYDKDGEGGGHAMIVYKVANGKLYVADPNYPGMVDRTIDFVNGKFTPYNSGKNAEEIAAGHGYTYEDIVYVGKTALVDWKKMYERWAQFKNGTVGDDVFPTVDVSYTDTRGAKHPLTDRLETDERYLNVSFSSFLGSQSAMVMVRDHQRLNRQSQGYELKPGANELGIIFYGITADSTWRYIDYKPYTVTYNEPTATTATTTTTSAAAPSKTWKLADTVLPTLPDMPVKFSDSLGSHEMTLTVTAGEIVCTVRTPGAGGVDKGSSTLTVTFTGPTETVTLEDKGQITADWNFTYEGEPPFTGSMVELRQGDFYGSLDPIRLYPTPTGTATFDFHPSGTEFEVTARVAVYGDRARIKWVYKLQP